MQRLIFLLFLTSSYFFVYGQEEKEYQKAVSTFISYFKSSNKEKLAATINFPLEREYPIPDIKNKQEFLKRFNEIFDYSLIKMIMTSNPSGDWSAMGWRGIMFSDGKVWLDYDGKLIAVNYQSEFEKKRWKELVQTDKNNLHESVKNFERPVYLLETTKYRIRIDDLGDCGYRYSSWSIKSKMSDKPDLVIMNGEFIQEGSGGNCTYEFKNGEYVYDCSIIIIGEENSPPALLTIFKDAKEILSQKAKIIRK